MQLTERLTIKITKPYPFPMPQGFTVRLLGRYKSGPIGVGLTYEALLLRSETWTLNPMLQQGMGSDKKQKEMAHLWG